ncbi:2Fe-2S iron-sulfur cluster binding domain-containing protein [Xylophilus rhododendri]|uniref:2Fe-2S iron-sulfur cluster binding domain-containing protein n=1 Tax=Xylophilus rhododendri TaxID=2697032 RepID=A0A857J236_9BURK|nr:adenylate/guanylate cyclase domain-containing protein [Xylophilus rhododendri]QHI96935.1 2Fe-2S iron-sulfur cluster binding domain-containing protein [Xylophilus rhododendri]
MSDAPSHRSLPARFPGQRQLRWASGLVLLAYTGLHLLDHALGLVSLAVADLVLALVRGFWHGAFGSLLLYGAASLHLVLAFVGVWERRSLRLPATEAIRILLGFALPLLLAGHLAAMRWAYEAYGLDPDYARAIRGIWSPRAAAFQLCMMAAAWAHGCLGLHMALRARMAWRRMFPLVLCLMVLLPVLATLGFVAMGREIAWTGAPAQMPTAAQSAAASQVARTGSAVYLVLLALLLASRALRARWQRAAPQAWITLHYPGRQLRVPRGWSVLEASREHGIAHLSVCGGRARCSTCRVRVNGPASALPAMGHDEAQTLARVKAPPDVRLACQLRPLADITVLPLFVPGAREAAGRVGRERDVAILFVDLRRWSGLSERQWPFDLVYTLDRYFEIVGGAVQDSGGTANQFIGDSVMAIFGLETDLPTACRQAVAAARLIGQRMDAWSAAFEREFGQPIAFGMGLHAGRAVVAEVGWQDSTTFSAVGEVVNTASRLQDHSKTSAGRLVMSVFVAQQAGLPVPPGEVERVNVRGRGEPLDVLHAALA